MSEQEQWQQYLIRMVEKDEASGQALNRFWEYVQTLNAPIPTAVPGDDAYFHLAWDNGNHHLDVDVLRSSLLEWFYRNREMDELDGDEESGNEGFEKRMKLIVGNNEAQ